jgi:hypothetical protein
MAVVNPAPRVTQSTPLASTPAPAAVAPVSSVAQTPITLTPTASPVALASVQGPLVPQSIATAPPISPALSSNPPATTVSIPASDPAPAIVPVKGDRLLGIDRLLAQADELPVPPPPRPQFEKPKLAGADTAKAKKAAEPSNSAESKKAEAKKADAKKADVKKAEAKKAEEAKKAAEAKADREAIGIAGTNWVQLAGGSNADRMGLEFRRLAAQSPALKKRGGAVTAGKDYFRLLAGPFPTRDAAQAFVNQLAKDGVDGFSWTRTPATLKIEKLSPK